MNRSRSRFVGLFGQEKMSAPKFKLGLFYGKGDFGKRKKKMKVLLSYHKVAWTLEVDKSKWPPKQLQKKEEIREEEYLIFLHLADNIIK